MTLKESPQARLLARLMSDISEDHFCAGWLIGCEYALWADLTGQEVAGERAWGISEEQKEELRFLHEAAGGWVMWSESSGEKVFLSTEEWLNHLASCTPRT
jgi:hypothetical protein